MNISILPPEILFHILSFLDTNSLENNKYVCKRFLAFTNDEFLWKFKCIQIELNLYEKFENKSWKWYFYVFSNELKCMSSDLAKKICAGYKRFNDGIYYGDWMAGNPNGFGYHICSSSTSIGQWKDGYLDGVGQKMFSDSDSYKGRFQKGSRIKGMRLYSNGDSYNGDWCHGVRSGKGIYKWCLGDHYEGHWENGNISGFGSFYWNDGRKYVGFWREHKHDGLGIHEWPDGSEYRGEWRRGKRHGKGLMIWNNDCEWEGQWIFDNRVNDEPMVERLWDNFFNESLESQKESAKKIFCPKIR